MSAHPGLDGPQHARSPSLASSSRPRSQHGARKDHGPTGQASWLSSVINLVNTIVGAGVLAMPLALSHMGILLGTAIILWAGATAGFGLYLQTRCARYLDRGTSSFFALSQITYPNAAVLFDAAIALKCFGVGISYLIIIGQLMPGVVKGFSPDSDLSAFLLDRHFWITAFMLVLSRMVTTARLIVIPFSFLRRLDSLKYTSVIALISIGYLVVLVTYHYFKGDTLKDRGRIQIVTWGGPQAFLSNLPVMVFAYTCHQNMFSILNEMKDKSPARTTAVVTASIGSASSVYIIVAILGYLSFGNNVAGNVVSMYTPSVASTIGKAAIVVLVMFSYPLQVHPCRASIDAVLRWRPSSTTHRSDDSSLSKSAQPLSPKRINQPSKSDGMGEARFAILTTVIIVLSYFVAMTVSSLEKVLAYVGSTGSTSISFILPGLFFYKISSSESPQHQRLLKEDDDEEERSSSGSEEDDSTTHVKHGPPWRRKLLRRLSLALAIYGILVMVVCLTTNTFFMAAH